MEPQADLRSREPEPIGHHWFITVSIDESKVLADVRRQSMIEPILVHWHSASEECKRPDSLWHRHAVYRDGELMVSDLSWSQQSA